MVLRLVSDTTPSSFISHNYFSLTLESLNSGDLFVEIAMSTKDEVPKKASRPRLIKLNTGFKLAEQWVKNMSKPSEDESTNVVLKARPPRLGLGAAVLRQHQVAPSNDPVERKLRSKLDAGKRKVGKNAEESAPSTRDASVDEDSDEELESRTKAFTKKRVKKK